MLTLEFIASLIHRLSAILMKLMYSTYIAIIQKHRHRLFFCLWCCKLVCHLLSSAPALPLVKVYHCVLCSA